jgi:hypothetical protein
MGASDTSGGSLHNNFTHGAPSLHSRRSEMDKNVSKISLWVLLLVLFTWALDTSEQDQWR